jgi:hypothetical protein
MARVSAALDRARRSWRAAEARLYPLAMTDVDGYQRALVLVAAVCRQLREDTTAAGDLLDCEERAAEYLAGAGEATGASTRGLDPDDIFGSAAALRDRELAGEEQRMTRLDAVDEARRAGSAWADLHTEDLGPRVPRLRIHIATGRTIMTELGADAATGAPRLLVTTALLDFTTGELSEASAAVTSVATVQEWEQVTAALQAKAP